MPPLQSLMAPRSRGSCKVQAPQTPEPFAEIETQPPSLPRPRFRLRKRNASHLNAPTKQFLASVAAEDVPLPSVEEHGLPVEDMTGAINSSFPRFDPYDFESPDGSDEKPRGRTFSPPKTPAPRAVPSLSPKRFPDWSLDQAYSSLESSPECQSSRPSTAQSTQTSASLFSRYSLNSDDFSQYSPETEKSDRLPSLLLAEDAGKTVKTSRTASSAKRSRKAPWTRSMSHHLWSTYMTYLQDPHVTPFRIGKNGIPPHGVCMRVAREAKRSWKGSRPQTRTHSKSGSATPTVDAPTTYMQWPHSCAATRAHLRELCKASIATTTRNYHYMGHSPTPFGRTANRFWNRRLAPLRSPSVFSGNDMTLSLAVSTCESMKPDGPLAQLTGSQPELASETHAPALAEVTPSAESPGTPKPERFRLGSPLIARSYGPSSSNSLADSFLVRPEFQRQSHTVGTRRRSLGSPARLNNSRNNTQRRRSRLSALKPRGSKRPSLGSDFWMDPSADNGDLYLDMPLGELGSTPSNQRDALFVSRTSLREVFEASQTSTPRENEVVNIGTHGSLAAPPTEKVRGLGSPFADCNTSFSFPNRRLSSISAIDFGVIRRPFATVQRPTDVNTTPTKSSLRSRLAFIDERLKDFRRCDQARRRSHSPF